MFANVQYILVEEWDAILQPCVAGLMISMRRKWLADWLYMFDKHAHVYIKKTNEQALICNVKPICLSWSLPLVLPGLVCRCAESPFCSCPSRFFFHFFCIYCCSGLGILSLTSRRQVPTDIFFFSHCMRDCIYCMQSHIYADFQYVLTTWLSVKWGKADKKQHWKPSFKNTECSMDWCEVRVKA